MSDRIKNRGIVIKILRQTKHWTQKELGVRVNRTHGSIHLIETNKRSMDNETVKEFCLVFEVEKSVIIGTRYGK